MAHILPYSQWKQIFEETGQITLLNNKIKTTVDQVLKKHGITIDALRSGLEKLKANALTEIDDIGEIIQGDQAVSANPRINESFSDYETLIDIGVDVISGILDGIPSGITQGASFTVDLLHTISYGIRSYLSDTSFNKIKYIALTILGAVTQFLPLAGNMTNVTAIRSIDGILKISPLKITKAVKGLVGKKVPLTHWSRFSKWKINLIYVILKLMGNFAQEVFEKMIKGFDKIMSFIKINIMPALRNNPFAWMISDYILPALTWIVSNIQDVVTVDGLAELVKL